ncbi:AfsR/SARP family transcriptional regulator [Streptomyces orinoci]|uniref:AfsR/SARP family transcriptional regulator n=1 Tax=Streptomyces orinoci TaxID=67339 RepID=A0ABV3K7Z8_STRON|nr:AfsR/SARP family transcriptional regulator [Streptomyces orinoci]
MRLEILGPVRVANGNTIKAIGAQKVEILLATLAIRSGQVVSVDQLITEIWGDEPPRSAIGSLYVYVSQVRKLLREPGSTASPVVTSPSGYMLTLGPGEFDLHDLTRLVKEGRVQLRNGEHEGAVRSFEEALALCRGPLPTAARGPILRGFQAWFDEIQLECREGQMEAHMALGHHRELVSDLYLLSTEHPLREVFHRQLMLALHRSDCRGDALLAYHQAWRTLREQLGVEPGPALKDIQRSILMDNGR